MVGWAHETTHLCASAHGRRAPGADRGSALLRRFCPAPLPDSARQRRGERAPGSPSNWAATTKRCWMRCMPSTPRVCDVLKKGLRVPTIRRHGRSRARAGRTLAGLLHRSPRDFGYPTSVWTLELAAQVSCGPGLDVAPASVARPSARRCCGWALAGNGPSTGSPAPTRQYARKKGGATG